MKTILASLLFICVIWTVSASALRDDMRVSTPMSRTTMEAVVGGDDCQNQIEITADCAYYIDADVDLQDEFGNIQRRSIWGCVGGALIGAVGIAGAIASMGAGTVVAIYGLSLISTSMCA
jgi:hypothetical protein